MFLTIVVISFVNVKKGGWFVYKERNGLKVYKIELFITIMVILFDTLFLSLFHHFSLSST